MARALLIWPVLLLIGVTLPALGKRTPPIIHQAVEIETLVNRAAEFLEERGPTAFADFRRAIGAHPSAAGTDHPYWSDPEPCSMHIDASLTMS